MNDHTTVVQISDVWTFTVETETETVHVGPPGSVTTRSVVVGRRGWLLYDDGVERWEYPVTWPIAPFVASGLPSIWASLEEWAEDVAATVEGRLISRTLVRTPPSRERA